eukprot:c4532_g1_i1.p1 GENE.c4532_g1_i1~~c4532_g1_i1.p1  ORF type:complete len:400 (-),score=64.75 c4532_g1_i1:150-1349(-)
MMHLADRQLFCLIDWHSVHPYDTIQASFTKIFKTTPSSSPTSSLKHSPRQSSVDSAGHHFGDLAATDDDDDDEPSTSKQMQFSPSWQSRDKVSASPEEDNSVMTASPPQSHIPSIEETQHSSQQDHYLEDECVSLWGNKFTSFVDDYYGVIPVIPLRSCITLHKIIKSQSADANKTRASLRQNSASETHQRMNRRERFRLAGWDLRPEDTSEFLKHAVTNSFLAASNTLTQHTLQTLQASLTSPPLSPSVIDIQHQLDCHLHLVIHSSSILPVRLHILKQGWLKKQSKTLKVWRWRWVIVTKDALLTYKWEQPEADISTPTTVIPLRESVLQQSQKVSRFSEKDQSRTRLVRSICQVKIKERDKRIFVRSGDKQCMFEALTTEELNLWHNAISKAISEL